MQRLDPHQRPPEGIRHVYKKYQKMRPGDVELDRDIVDLTATPHDALPPRVRIVRELEAEHVNRALRSFAGQDASDKLQPRDWTASSLTVYEHEDMPGLHIIPSLLPPEIQPILLSRLLHRDLSNPAHLTNIHTHYNITYPPSNTADSSCSPSSPSTPPHTSFFSTPPSSTTTIASPIDPTVHKPLSTSQMLNKKLRWTTLGGQYNWTSKAYPLSAPPPFPPDLKALLESLFPSTRAEAAIVNLYSPGDTLSVHRDVAETSATGLVSVSLGCDAVFVIGARREDEEQVVVMRLKSGSAVYMSGDARFAWHGVPQIVGATCPDFLENWPAGAHGAYDEWRGWMRGKRVNLNVRQMWD